MRHRVYGKKLSKNKNERTALFKSLVQELFLHGTITTSESKAKAIKGLVDKIITQAKDKNSQRLLQAFFGNQVLQDRVIKEVAPKLGARVSGYTSMVRMGVQAGDNTTVVKMSLIGAEELKPLEKVTSYKLQGTVKKTKEKEQAKKAVFQKKPVIKKTSPVKARVIRKRVSKTK